MFRKVQVNFNVFDPRGWVCGCDVIAPLDASSPLPPQLVRAAEEWVESRNRIFGSLFQLTGVTSAFFEVNGFWHVRTPDEDWDG